LARIGWLIGRDRSLAPRAGFCWYLAGVGAVAILTYAAAKVPGAGTIRYLLLALLLPVGLVGGLLAIEPAAAVRRAVVAMMIAWAAVAAADSAAYIRRYAAGQEPNEMRALANALVARRIDVIKTDYWHAYNLSFLTREEVVAASSDFVRIAEYQDKALAAGDRLWEMRSRLCPGGEPIGELFLCSR
jgi:hypothetical protein